MSAAITITVTYALPQQQVLRELTVPVGTTARMAVQLSKLAEAFPEIDATHCKLGVFGTLVHDAYCLNDGDRLEIYRPLLIDPKVSRRQRADSARIKARNHTHNNH